MAENSVQRRLAAILAADVVGYSRLIEHDDAGTLAILKLRRSTVIAPLVDKHCGRIFKTTGDGVFVEFASAINALQCSIDVQHAMALANTGEPDDRHIILRVGVHLGEIMVDGDDLYGEGVNVAARLEAKAGSGDIYISEDTYRQVRGKLGVEFEDVGEHSLKNMSFPVRIYRVLGTATARNSATTVAERPSIVVLPFASMSDIAGQQYLSDGITEDIITELSRCSSLLVIARNSAFQFRGDNIDIAAVRRKLGVRYVLEGSVRASAERLRITAQLIDAVSETHIWADRFDRRLEDIFDIQDEIARTVAATVEGRVSAAGIERLRRKPTADWVAYDYFLQGRDLVNRSRMAEGEAMLAKAVKLDPSYAHAHAFRAIALAGDDFSYGNSGRLEQALAAAQRALVLDDHDAWCHQAMGYVQFERHRLDLAEPHFERAIRINPNDTGIVGDRANWLIYAGRAEEALQSVTHAMQRDPYPPPWVWSVHGHALFLLGRYEDALASFSRRADESSWAMMQMSAAQAKAGHIEAAKREVSRIIANHPNASISHFRAGMCYANKRDETEIIEALRLAGLPD